MEKAQDAPAQRPVQALNQWPAAAVAERETAVPAFSVALQTVRPAPAPQLRPPPVTWPFAGTGEILKTGLANVTATVASASIATSQLVPVPEQPPPLQERTE